MATKKKKIIGQIRLQLPAGQANPSPPVGPALGQHGVNIMGFCKEFNSKTQSQAGMIIPVVISVYQDRSFTFVMKTPPVSVLIKKELGLRIGGKPGTGSANPHKDKVGTISMSLVRKIAEIKMPDTNAASIESCMRSVMGTARSMGVDVTE